MRITLFLFLSFCLLFAGGEHDHDHAEEHGHRKDFVEIKEEHIRELGIKTKRVKKVNMEKFIRVPAEVVENPLLSASVSSPVEGIVVKLFVKEGDKVSKGNPLALIYSPEILDLKTETDIAKIRFETAEKIFRRDKELYERKLIKYTRYYNSLVEYERAKGIYEALKNKLSSYGNLEGNYLLIRSPIDGFVVEQNIIKGSSVSLDIVMFKVHSHEILWVYGFVPYEESILLKEGIDGTVVVGNERLPCKIDYIHHEVDEKTKRVKVRCITKNRDHILKAGAFVSLEIHKEGKKGILIPKRAVQDIEGEKIVFVKKEKGFEPRKVLLGKEIGAFYHVVKGLKEGEIVAVEGAVFLKSKLVGVEAAGHAH